MNNNLQQIILSYKGIDTRSISKHPGYTVMIIDMQELFFKHIHPYDEERLIASQKEVIEYCIESYIPVFRINYEKSGKTHPEVQKMLRNVPLIGVYSKKGEDAFNKHGRLSNILRNNGIDKIFMMGIYGTICLHKSAMSAREKKFNVSTAGTVIAENFDNRNKYDRRNMSILFEESDIEFYDTHVDFINHLQLTEHVQRSL
ncbi:MAG: isochorismatase family protein [Candidatus Woesearchaeota archaeon]